MPLLTTRHSTWPCLAWLAHCRAGDPAIRVACGGSVDVTPDFLCEAVWDGPFADGGFDLTDNVFGSGVRLRGDGAMFVSSCGTNDRLCSAVRGEEAWISNSLPCLMQALGADPDPSVTDYPELLESAVRGLGRYRAEVPTTAGPVRVTYHHNLAWDGQTLSESTKPWPDRPFTDFASYFAFMDATVEAFAGNMADPARQVRRTFLGTMSSGYDSTTCAALARPHGLEEAISFASARGGADDSGAAVAERLGLRVTTFPRDAFRAIPFAETPFLASDAKGEDVYFAAAAPLLRDRVLLTGYHGDSMWGKSTSSLGDFIQRTGGGSGLSHTEARLHAGYINVILPFLAVRDIAKLHAISNSAEMRPWSVAGKADDIAADQRKGQPRCVSVVGAYDRPICRRIVESMGVPRTAFGQSKKAASVLFGFGFADLSHAGRVDFDRWLQSRDAPGLRKVRSAMIENLARVRGRTHRLPLGARLLRALEGPYDHPRMLPLAGGLIDDVRRCSIGLQQRNLLYQWATAQVKGRYATTSSSEHPSPPLAA